jgi:pimeloyl-ACP methyl ester carboxylesterase
MSDITRRDLAALAAGAFLAGSEEAEAQAAPTLDIAEWSHFFVGVERVKLARGTVVNGAQMYVEYQIPARVRHPYPVVLVHGDGGQGTDWMTTPDGRPGWATMLLEQGFKVYVVDRPGQGRPPYHPYLNGYFEPQAWTFERASQTFGGKFDGAALEQAVAPLGPAMPAGATTRAVWRSRGAMLLDEIGPAIFITHGDGSTLAWEVAEERPKLVRGIVALEPAPSNRSSVSGIPVTQIRGAYQMMERDNREKLRPVLDWIAANVPGPAPAAAENRNIESTAVKLSEQGCFWVGIKRKQMSYGTIPLGQMFVQYMIPAERRHRFSVVLVHGGGGQGTHMMGIGRRPGWAHFFVQAGYATYWLDRPGFGRSPYHPDALGPSHLRNFNAYEGLVDTNVVFATAQWPGPGGIGDPLIDQFMAAEVGRVADEVLHSDLAIQGAVELLDKIGPSIVVTHAFGGFLGWLMADRRPDLVKAIVAMEPNGNPFADAFRWGLTAIPMTYDPPVTDPAQFRLVDKPAPPDSPLPIVRSYKLQADPPRRWKNLQKIPIAWMTTEFGAGGNPFAQVDFLKQVGCSVDLLRLREYGITGNGNLMIMEKNNHEVFGVIREWIDKKAG